MAGTRALTAAGTSVRSPGRGLAALLVAGGIGWIVVNGPFEGPVLVTLSYDHGITMADLISVAAFLTARALWRRS